MEDIFDGIKFEKSTKCTAAGNCVEVARASSRIGVRDSKANGSGPILSFTPDEWAAFVAGVKSGEFD